VLITLALVVAAAAISCATAPYTPSERSITRLAALIDSGRVGSVKGLAAAPFLLDGEILLRQSDVDAAWANFAAAKLSLRSPKVASIARIGPDSYASFGSSMDVRVFFKKYLDKNSSLVALDTADGRYYLLLNREVSGYPRIQGIAGPLK
jgi:hypothetical protein